MRQVQDETSGGVCRDDLSVVPGWYAQGHRPHFPVTDLAPAAVVAATEGRSLPFPPAWRLLTQACWSDVAEARPSFPELERALKLLRDVPRWPEPELDPNPVSQPQPEPETQTAEDHEVLAREWLTALSWLTDEQINTAVAYVQETGVAKELCPGVGCMDAGDFEDMVTEMEMDDFEGQFRAAVLQLENDVATAEEAGGNPSEMQSQPAPEPTAAAAAAAASSTAASTRDNRWWVELLAWLEGHGVDPHEIAQLQQQQPRTTAVTGRSTDAETRRLRLENEELLAEVKLLREQLATLAQGA